MARTPSTRRAGATPTNSLERALLILDRVAGHRYGLTNKELSGALGIATSSCSYILERLERNGFLARDAESGRYTIGLKAIAVARGALRPLDFRKAAEPVLRRLSESTGLEMVLGVMDQGRLMILIRISTGKFPRADVDTGTEFPPHTTAVGKVLLAQMSAPDLEQHIAGHELVSRASRTITSKSKLLEEMDTVRQRGYALTDEEHLEGMRSVGVPIADPWGKIDAALAAIGTVKDLVWDKNLDDTVRVLRDAAREIAALRRSRQLA